jgi:hypothetical protein
MDSGDDLPKLQIFGPEPNRIDVNICWKLDFLRMRWYFIGNWSSVAGRIYPGKIGSNRKF